MENPKVLRLPDSCIGRALSFLPKKEAVKLRLVCKRFLCSFQDHNARSAFQSIHIDNLTSPKGLPSLVKFLSSFPDTNFVQNLTICTNPNQQRNHHWGQRNPPTAEFVPILLSLFSRVPSLTVTAKLGYDLAGHHTREQHQAEGHVIAFLASNPHLTELSLTLNDCEGLQSIPSFHLPNLTKLCLSLPWVNNSNSTQLFCSFVRATPNLVHIRTSRLPKLEPCVLEVISPLAKNLRHLELAFTEIEHTATAQFPKIEFPALRTLALQSDTKETAPIFVDVVNNSPLLEKLELRVEMDATTISSLLTNPHVTTLSIAPEDPTREAGDSSELLSIFSHKFPNVFDLTIHTCSSHIARHIGAKGSPWAHTLRSVTLDGDSEGEFFTCDFCCVVRQCKFLESINVIEFADVHENVRIRTEQLWTPQEEGKLLSVSILPAKESEPHSYWDYDRASQVALPLIITTLLTSPFSMNISDHPPPPELFVELSKIPLRYKNCVISFSGFENAGDGEDLEFEMEEMENTDSHISFYDFPVVSMTMLFELALKAPNWKFYFPSKISKIVLPDSLDDYRPGDANWEFAGASGVSEQVADFLVPLNSADSDDRKAEHGFWRACVECAILKGGMKECEEGEESPMYSPGEMACPPQLPQNCDNLPRAFACLDEKSLKIALKTGRRYMGSSQWNKDHPYETFMGFLEETGFLSDLREAAEHFGRDSSGIGSDQFVRNIFPNFPERPDQPDWDGYRAEEDEEGEGIDGEWDEGYNDSGSGYGW